MTLFLRPDDLPVIAVILATGAAAAVAGGLLFLVVRRSFEAVQNALAGDAS